MCTECLIYPHDIAQPQLNTKIYRWHVVWTLPLEIGYYFMIPIYVSIIKLCGSKGWIVNALILIATIPASIYTVRTHHQGLGPNLHVFLTGSAFGIIQSMVLSQKKNHSILLNSTTSSRPTSISKRQSTKRKMIDTTTYIIFIFLASQASDRLLYSWFFTNPFPKTGDFPRFTSFWTGTFYQSF